MHINKDNSNIDAYIIPVHSNDYAMMHEAEKVVARIMKLAESLDGIIFGEHGIGITKYQFLSADKRENLLYSPRNKILATGLLIEAVLYKEQTRRGISLDHYANSVNSDSDI